jgi:hypothetical protein
LEYLKEKDHLEDLGDDGRIIKKISGKWGGKVWPGFM